MKNAAGPITYNANVWGGRQVSGCVYATSKLKLHRKRVVHTPKRQDSPVQERGFAFQPDYTFLVPSPVTTRHTSVITATVGTT